MSPYSDPHMPSDFRMQTEEATSDSEEIDEDLRRALQLSLQLGSGSSAYDKHENAITPTPVLVPPSLATSGAGQPMAPAVPLAPDWKDFLAPQDADQKHREDTTEVLLQLHTLRDTQNLFQQPGVEKDLMLTHPVRATQMFRDAIRILFHDPFVLTPDELNRWWLSCFRFSHYNSYCEVALVQEYAGPCGVLAPLQCWIFLYMLLCKRECSPGAPKANSASETRPYTAYNTLGTAEITPTSVLNAPRTGYDASPFILARNNPYPPSLYSPFSKDLDVISLQRLAWALTVCFYRATPNSQYYWAQLRCPVTSPFTQLRCELTSTLFMETVEFTLHCFLNIRDLHHYLLRKMLHENIHSAPGVVLSFVISLVLTRSLTKIRLDMDDPETPFVGLYGHCSQELVNLLLTGEAVSNVFDGDRVLGGTDSFAQPRDLSNQGEQLTLRGIHRKQVIGYLTELEAMRYCAVGQHLKSPLFPIWVVGNSNHFTSMFCYDTNLTSLLPSEERQQALSRTFSVFDKEESGIVLASQLPGLLDACGLSYHLPHARQVLDPPGQGGAILKSEFLEWAESVDPSSVNRSTPESARAVYAASQSRSFILYHYDGQITSEAPTLIRMILDLCTDSKETEPPTRRMNTIEEDEDHVSSGLRATLKTCWKNAKIAETPSQPIKTPSPLQPLNGGSVATGQISSQPLAPLEPPIVSAPPKEPLPSPPPPQAQPASQFYASQSALPVSKAMGGPDFVEYPVCDVAFESTVCIFNGEHVILPPARPYGIVGHYSFDAVRPLDTSGHKNHAYGTVIATTPFGTGGAAALFRQNYLIIPHSPSFESSDYSITFWIYRLEDTESIKLSTGGNPLEVWCPVLHKGALAKETDGNNQLEATPSILLDPSTGRLKVTESTTEVSAAQGEFFISNSRLTPHRWSHIAVVRHLKRLRLYINGILDSTMETQGITKINKMPFYVGGAPWAELMCDTPFALDELKIYVIPVGRDVIQAEAAPALAGVEPSSLFLSCTGCTRLQAEEGCPEGFHLCTRLELLMGGYSVLRQMGLIRSAATHVFTGENSAEALQIEEGAFIKEQPTAGIGLCCRDSL